MCPGSMSEPTSPVYTRRVPVTYPRRTLLHIDNIPCFQSEAGGCAYCLSMVPELEPTGKQTCPDLQEASDISEPVPIACYGPHRGPLGTAAWQRSKNAVTVAGGVSEPPILKLYAGPNESRRNPPVRPVPPVVAFPSPGTTCSPAFHRRLRPGRQKRRLRVVRAGTLCFPPLTYPARDDTQAARRLPDRPSHWGRGRNSISEPNHTSLR